MAEKFAFESDEVSIAFSLRVGLGDAVYAKKVFDALIELAPNCVADIFGDKQHHLAFAKSFFCDSKNLNNLFLRDESFPKIFQKYDLSLWPISCNAIILEWANFDRLRIMAPALLESVIKIDEYNKRNVYGHGHVGLDVPVRNMAIAKILHKNGFYFLSSDGALPIRDDKVKISLTPEYKPQFDALDLGKYITIYSDIYRNARSPKVKTWPIRYLCEYVLRMKKNFPKLTIIQCGGGVDVQIENVDRHFRGVDLELTKYILANSLLHVGCEGGLIHLATALGTKCLVLFGSTPVDYFGYDRNINLVSDICSPCHDMLIDDTVCLRGAKEPPCMLSHTPQLVCDVTCNYLKNNL